MLECRNQSQISVLFGKILVEVKFVRNVLEIRRVCTTLLYHMTFIELKPQCCVLKHRF